jgi:hypothetical protein
MQVIVDSLISKDFNHYSSSALKRGWDYIEKHKDALTTQFLECSKDHTEIDIKAKEKIHETLV